MQGVKNVWKKFLGFLEGGAEEDWDEERDYVEYHARRDYEYDEGIDFAGLEKRDYGRAKKVNNVLEFESVRAKENQITLRISRPKEMQDATLICEYLQEKMICVVDMQGVEQNNAQRIADYLGGVAYALRGHVERIDNYIFVMAPEGVKIDSDLREDLKSSLFKFK